MTEQKLIDVLIELRVASLKDPIEAMKKYDMLFIGPKMNEIETTALRHCLKNKFGVILEMKELLNIVPSVCTLLKMKYEPYTLVEDETRSIADYSIKLY